MSEERTWRGYRPGRFRVPNQEEFDAERTLRLANVEKYARRVVSRLPLFEDDQARREKALHPAEVAEAESGGDGEQQDPDTRKGNRQLARPARRARLAKRRMKHYAFGG